MYNSAISPPPEIVLKDIALQVINNAPLVKNSGLFYGRMGIAIFLYHYALHYHDSRCLQTANRLIDDIFEHLGDVRSLNYSNGLAGIGAGFEYLVANGFIDVDTNDLLSDVDNSIHECIKHEPAEDLNLLLGTGFAKYCIQRVHPLQRGANQALIDTNRDCISHVIDLLEVSHLWYDNLLSVIDFLSEAHTLQINQEKADHYLHHAFNKLETIVYEDLQFRLLHNDCNPLRILAHCSLAAYRTQNQALYETTCSIFQAFQEKGQSYLNVHEASIESAIKQALISKKLAADLRQASFNQLSAEWLQLFLNKHGQRLLQPNEKDRTGLADGYAGDGMALLSLLEKVSTDWIDHLIVYH